MARYDLTAKVQPDAKPDDIKLMLQSLLEERFALKTHKETKTPAPPAPHRRQITQIKGGR